MSETSQKMIIAVVALLIGGAAAHFYLRPPVPPVQAPVAPVPPVQAPIKNKSAGDTVIIISDDSSNQRPAKTGSSYLLFQHKDGWTADDVSAPDPTNYHADASSKVKSWTVEDANPDTLVDPKNDHGVIKGGPKVDVDGGTFSVQNCFEVDAETLSCSSVKHVADTTIPKDHTKANKNDHSSQGGYYFIGPGQ